MSSNVDTKDQGIHPEYCLGGQVDTTKQPNPYPRLGFVEIEALPSNLLHWTNVLPLMWNIGLQINELIVSGSVR